MEYYVKELQDYVKMLEDGKMELQNCRTIIKREGRRQRKKMLQ